MRKRHCSLLLAVWLLAVSAWADDHWGDACGSGAYNRASNLWGWQAALTIPLGHHLKPSALPSPIQANLVYETSKSSGDHEEGKLKGTLKQESHMAGFRWTFTRKKHKHFLPFGQLLFGRVRREGVGLDAKLWGFAFGAGTDYVPHRPKSSRIAFGLRGQADYVFVPTAISVRLYPRATGGLFLRIE